ncbi:MAG TPA: DNA polymerase domain-containing protein [Terriglobia bacterium]|nr:DNA polymerase domain-containing protein [Terriglobia bacterium]
MTLWLIPSAGDRKRRRLIDRSFTPSFYVHGSEAQLRRLARTLARSAAGRATCALTERMNIWDGRPLVVLQISVRYPTQYAALARFVRRSDASLRLYNSDLMLAAVYCWEKNIFPLARMDVEIEGARCEVRGAREGKTQHFAPRTSDLRPHTSYLAPDNVRAIECRDDEWEINYELPPLTIMHTRLEGLARVNPQHGRSGSLEVAIDGEWRVLDDAEEPVVLGFERMLRAHDPDLIVSEWGDSTLFPGLLRQARKNGFELSLNREKSPVERSRARSYMSYGRILFKESATTLRGRLHVDTQNSFIADECELDGLWELARVTKLPVQYCARTTTGTGISYMQMELAYRDGTLIPEQKAEPESPKHPAELLRADRGGLVFPPRLGFFSNVGELDFVSEFPSIMARFNVSPETVNCPCCPDAPRIPELGYHVCQRRRGITSRVVECLIEKRQRYKEEAGGGGPGAREGQKVEGKRQKEEDRAGVMASLSPEFQIVSALPQSSIINRQSAIPGSPSLAANYKLRRSSLKWLLVCCFGYTGYKNARFGKIEAHEAINALAREKLLVAKEIAEQQGYRVLHALVDSIYVQKEGVTREDYERLTLEIEQTTRLPMALEAVYRYVIFLPSKQSREIPVPNRFFCVSEEGELKIRGLECRRHDTPPLVVRMQMEALGILAGARDFEGYCRKLEEAREVLERYLARVQDGGLRIEDFVISRRLTRAPGEYKQSSATAIVARQLDQAGVHLRPGESVQYIITDAQAKWPDDRYRAWTLWEGWRGYDVNKYQAALRDAFKPLSRFATAPMAMNFLISPALSG